MPVPPSPRRPLRPDADRDPRPGTGLDHLLAAVRAGDGVAFADLMCRFRPVVLRSALRVTSNLDDAEDAAQQTWLRLWQHADQVQQPDALPGWLATTARREALRIATQRTTPGPLDLTALERLRDPSDEPDVLAERRETVEQVARALARMPAPAAQLLLQLVGHGRPYAEVSRELGRPQGSLGPLRARYLRQLSIALGIPVTPPAPGPPAEVAC